MTEASLRTIVEALNAASVKYLIVGGLAVNAHGYVRNTNDLDLLISLDPQNIQVALRVLKDLSYQPKVPVRIEDFADAANRETWIRDKQMRVFGLRSAAHQETDVDIFVDDPLGFDEAYRRVHFEALVLDSSHPKVASHHKESLRIPFCAYDDLVRLKKLSGRAKDLEDIEQLRISRGET